LIIIGLQVVLALLAASIGTLWVVNNDQDVTYLGYNNASVKDEEKDETGVFLS